MSKLFYYSDVEIELSPYFREIEEKNSRLYNYLYEQMRDHEDIGIAEDMIKYLADNAADFTGNPQYLDMISVLACTINITVEHIKLVQDYYDSTLIHEENKLDPDDFNMVFTQTIEKNIRVGKIREILFNNSDREDIYDTIFNYSDSESLDESVDGMDGGTLVQTGNESIVSHQEVEADVVKNNDISFSEMFQSIVGVVNYSKDANDDSIVNFKNKIEGINGAIAKASSDLSVCITEMVAEMQNDKTTIARLNFLLSIQQKAFSSQQMKLNEARNEIARLQARIKANEEAEINQREISKKIAELSNLSSTQLTNI